MTESRGKKYTRQDSEKSESGTDSFEDTAVVYAPAPKLIEAPTPKAPEPAPNPVERGILCKEFVRGKGALGTAFIAENQLAGRPQKKGRSEWDKEFAAWLVRPR